MELTILLTKEMNFTSLRILFGRLLLAVGSLLCLVIFYGAVLCPPVEKIQSEGIVSGYNLRTLSVSEANSRIGKLKDLAAEGASKRELAEKLFRIISASFIHSDSYVLKPWDNWVLWIDQQFGRPYVSTQDAELLRQRGGGFCLQSAMVYVNEAKKLGLDAQIALLNGHVATEVSVEGGKKIVVDSDLGILWDNPLSDFGKKISASEVTEKIEERGFGKEYAQQIAAYYVSSDDNTLINFPLSQGRYEYEQTAEFLSNLIPPLLVLIGFVLSTKRRAT